MSKSIAPKDIESELDKLWGKYRDSKAVRACLFNLIICAKKDYRESYLKNIAKNMIRKYPCRMLMITEDDRAEEDYLRSTVADVRAEEKDDTVFCELINFEVSSGYANRIPYVIRPHILPDLPVYMLWGEDPTKNHPAIMQLENIATRTIFDSETTEHFTQFAEALLKEQAQVGSDIADLNWARTEDWRALLATTFNSERKISTLKSAQNICIDYNAVETRAFCHTRIQPTYVTTWLACQLGWTYKSAKTKGDDLIFTFSTAKSSVDISIHPQKMKDVAPGKLLRIDITNASGDHILFERVKEHPHLIKIDKSTLERCDLPTFHFLDREKSGRSLIKEIFHQGTSEVFFNVLSMITTFERGIICS